MDFVFPPQATASLPVRGTDARFPIHRIYCVGRNYAAHTIEMGFDPDRDDPFFFQKNPDCVVTDGADFPYPPQSQNVHHEIEMTVALGQGGTDIPVETALDHVWGYGVSLDMTRRDLQGVCKKMGRPWEVGKAFEHSAPSSELVQVSEVGHPAKGAVWLDVNGERRQEGDLSQLIWSVSEMISYISGLFTLQQGDLIMSGTPSGVGPVSRGDQMHGYVEGVGELRCKVV